MHIVDTRIVIHTVGRTYASIVFAERVATATRPGQAAMPYETSLRTIDSFGSRTTKYRGKTSEGLFIVSTLYFCVSNVT